MAVRTGTVTFLFTDIEGSTRLWEEHPTTMGRALEIHDRIIRTAVDDHGGHIFATGGDGFNAAFSHPVEAARAALDAQDRLQETVWPTGDPITVRMGIHTGIAEARGGDYFGPPLNFTARIMGAVDGRQIAVSETTSDLLRHHLEDWGRLERIRVGRARRPGRRTPVSLLTRSDAERVGLSRPATAIAVMGALAVGAATLAMLSLIGEDAGRAGTTTEPTVDTTSALETATTIGPAVTTVGAHRVIWRVEDFGELIGEPAVVADRVAVASRSRSGLTLVDPSGETEVWSLPGAPLTTPVPYRDMVLVGIRGGILGGYDIGDGSEQIRCTFGFLEVTTRPTPGTDSIFVAVADQGRIHRLDVDSGACSVAEDISTIRGRVDAPLALLEDRLLALDNLGSVYLFDAGTLVPAGASAQIGQIAGPVRDGAPPLAAAVVRTAGSGGMLEIFRAFTVNERGFVVSIDIATQSVELHEVRSDGNLLITESGDLLAVVIGDDAVTRRLQQLDPETLVPIRAAPTELGTVTAGPIKGDGRIYVADGSRVQALDATSLSVLWEVDLGISAVAMAEIDGVVVVSTEAGDLIGLDASS